jgi:hypothetical protein
MSSNEIIILIFGVIIIVACWDARERVFSISHPVLLIYLVVVMLCVKLPWNFVLIFTHRRVDRRYS